MHPVADLDRAIEFYQAALGMTLKFRDGDRFCALDCGGTTIALGAGDEGEATLGRVAVAYKVEDIEAAVAELEAAGARLVVGPARGPHEEHAALEDRDGNLFSVYRSR